MADNFRKIVSGVNIVPKTGTSGNQLGDLEVNSSDSKLYLHDGVSSKIVPTADSSDILKNKKLEDSSTEIVDNADNTKKLKFEVSGITTATTRTLTAPDADTTIVGTAVSQTLSNKTLDNSTTATIKDSNLTIQDNADATKQMQFEASGITAGATRVLTIPDASTTLVGTAVSQTLSNKTLDNTSTITVKDSNLTLQDNADTSKQAQFELTNITTATTRTFSLPDANTSLVGTATSQTLSNKTIDNSNSITVQDSSFTIQDNADNTKQIKFEASGVTTGTTRTLTAPNANTTIVGTDAAQVITAKDIDGGTASNTSRLTLPKNSKTNLDALTRKQATIVYASDSDKVYFDDGTNLRALGEGSGGVNYITNPDAEANTTGWAAYADAAASRPVDGTGGSPSVTFSRSTTTPLRGTADFNFVKDAANRQGQGVSADFTIASADKGKMLGISFECELVSGTYDSGTASTDSDIVVVIYDVTNATNLEPIPLKLSLPVAGNTSKFYASFPAASNSTSYRLCLHTATTSAAAFTIALDSVSVSPVQTLNQVPMTDPVSEAVTITSSGGGSITLNTGAGYLAPVGIWSRHGKFMRIQYAFRNGNGGAATGSAGSVYLSVPQGLTIDTSVLTPQVGGTRGDGFAVDNGLVTQSLMAFSSTQIAVLIDATDNYLQVSELAAGYYISGVIEVPIVQWSSNITNTAPSLQGGVVAAEMYSVAGAPTGTISGSFNIVKWPTKVKDTSGSYDTSTGFYTVPITGFYDISALLAVSGTFLSTDNDDFQIKNNTTSTTLAYISPVGPASTNRRNSIQALSTFLTAGDQVGIYFATTATGNSYVGNSATSRLSFKLVAPSQVVPADSKTRNVRTVTASTTLLPTDDIILVDTTSGTVTVTLPSVSSMPGRGYSIEKTDSSANTVSIARSGTDTIEAATTLTLNTQYERARIDSDGGTIWRGGRLASIGSSGNLVGNANGVTVASGSIGEKVAFTSRTVTTTTGTWTVNSSAVVTLTAGVWILFANVSHSASTAANNWRYSLSTNNTNDSSGLVAVGSDSTNNASSANDPIIVVPPYYHISSSSQSFYAKAFTEDTAGSVTFDGFAVRIA